MHQILDSAYATLTGLLIDLNLLQADNIPQPVINGSD